MMGPAMFTNYTRYVNSMRAPHGGEAGAYTRSYCSSTCAHLYIVNPAKLMNVSWSCSS